MHSEDLEAADVHELLPQRAEMWMRRKSVCTPCAEEMHWHWPDCLPWRSDLRPCGMQELQALTEAVGVVSRGLTADTIAKLPESIYIHPSSKPAAKALQGPVHCGCDEDEQCAICRMEFETGNKVKHLPCKHVFHPGCIDQWLGINKVSPNSMHLLPRRC